MKSLALLVMFVAYAAAGDFVDVDSSAIGGDYKDGGSATLPTMQKYVLTQADSLQPEWQEASVELSNQMVGGKFTDVYQGGTTDYKDEVVNMTPYVRQTKDQRWEAGVPNYEAPEEGYFIRTFSGGPLGESEARDWVLDKTAAKNTINYVLAPDVDPEENLPNPSNPEDKNPNTMQDNVPTAKPVREVSHLEPAYVGEYSEQEIFGDSIEGQHEAQRVRVGDNSDVEDEVAAGTGEGDVLDPTLGTRTTDRKEGEILPGFIQRKMRKMRKKRSPNGRRL